MLKVLLKIIKYILLTIDIIIILCIFLYYIFDCYDKFVGKEVIINDVEYELQEWTDFKRWKNEKSKKFYIYNILAKPKKKNFCEIKESDWILFNIPKIYKIYKESNMLVVVVPKDMDTTNLDLYIKKNFYERKVSDNVIRDYYKGVKRPGIKAVDLIVEYVDKE